MRSFGEFCIPADHPSLPGHFPGRPVVPGVVLLDAAFSLILAQRPGRMVTGVHTVKFTQPVRPGQRVAVACADGVERFAFADGLERFAFACAVAGQDVVRGVLTIGERP